MNDALRVIAPLLLTVSFVAAGGCDTEIGGGKSDPPVTEILRVEVEPDPVAVGDTATFTCVITDSTDSNLAFYWVLENTFEVPRTKTNTFEWVAPSVIDTFEHVVKVSGVGKPSTQEQFIITVIDPSDTTNATTNEP